MGYIQKLSKTIDIVFKSMTLKRDQHWFTDLMVYRKIYNLENRLFI